MAFGLASFFVALTKSNTLKEPIFIDEDKEDPFTLTPLQICDPHSKKQTQPEIQIEDDAYSEGKDVIGRKYDDAYFEGENAFFDVNMAIDQ